MTEIPAHPRKRAEEARQKAAAQATGNQDALVPEDVLLPGEPFSPPLTSAERERIAVILVNLRASTDAAVLALLESAQQAGDRATEAQQVLERRHRNAMITAVVGSFMAAALLVLVVALVATSFG